MKLAVGVFFITTVLGAITASFALCGAVGGTVRNRLTRPGPAPGLRRARVRVAAAVGVVAGWTTTVAFFAAASAVAPHSGTVAVGPVARVISLIAGAATPSTPR